MLNFSACVDRYADRTPDRVAVVFADERLTFSELRRRVDAVAAGLEQLGVGHNTVVALLMENCVEFLETTLAVGKLGAIFLPLNFRLAQPEWEYIVDNAGAVVIVAGESYADAALALRSQVPSLESVVVVGDPPASAFGYRQMREGGLGSVVTTFDCDDDQIQRLMYTSGTTSRPKGVPIRHSNVLWKIFGHVIEFRIDADDRTLMAGPMYHVGAYDLPGTGTLFAGGSLVILPRFDPVDVLSAIEAERPTNVWLAPAMVNALLQVEDRGNYDTTSIRFVINGGEKMPTTLVRELQELFPAGWLADAYGLTESVSGDTFLPQADTFDKLGSVGKPVSNLEVRIVSEDGTSLPAGETGEIALRGPKIVSEYWRDPDATARSFVDGWFRTGDVGHFDEDGYLYIDDRRKDMIISGGENIASPEIERVLYEHAAVLEAAVVALPDDRWGEVPRAVVVRKPGSDVSADELVEHCRERLAKFKVPKVVDFVDELPRNASGKVLKRLLRDPS